MERLAALADELMDQRAADRVGEVHAVLIEELVSEPGHGAGRGWRYSGRGAHQAPEVDGSTEVLAGGQLAVGDLVLARVSGSEGVDLVAELIDAESGGRPSSAQTVD